MPRLPLSPDDYLFYLVPAICFAGGWLSSVAGMGGGLLIVAACTQILPLPAAIPLTSVFVMSGQVARVIQFRRDIAWDITRPFIPGSLIGAGLGTFIFLSLPEDAIALLLGVAMLWFCWVPSTPASRALARHIPHPWFWVGIIHTFLSALSGVGGLFQAMMVNSQMRKEQVVATIAGTLVFMSLFKTVGYVAAGFDYLPWLWLIVLAWICGSAGSWVGRRTLYRLSDRFFRRLIRFMVTAFSLRLLWQALL